MASSLVAPRMTDAEYFSTPGLSHSGMKDLAVSPLRYWHRHVNPNRVAEEPTPEMQIGSAVHCAVLEPGEFDKRYACELVPPDDCLDTIEDLRSFIRNCGETPKGTRKAEVILQVQKIAPNVPILEVLHVEHAKQNAGRVIFKADDWARIHGCATALMEEPRLQEILSTGTPELAIFTTDSDTGVKLKGKLDWATSKLTLDLKTFVQKRGKSIDRSVADAILYENYHRQGFFYAALRGWPNDWNGEHVLAFVESFEPHETRIRSLRPKTAGNANMYWLRAQHEVRDLIRIYAAYMDKFGVDRPWRSVQEIEPLSDEDMPGLAY